MEGCYNLFEGFHLVKVVRMAYSEEKTTVELLMMQCIKQKGRYNKILITKRKKVKFFGNNSFFFT